ncbi:hypothetical protein [Salmonella enterica]|uniref:hypothetical protein n=1 Tax=Salmonella enterica TaxID=28901 RepID=UPI000DECBBDC|nr:hypothetical protein [Salmonella enterica]AXD10244.1 hypothetical protein CHE29_15795 [Salmonella enterica]
MKNSVNAIYQSQLTTHQDGIFPMNGSQHTEDNQVTLLAGWRIAGLSCRIRPEVLSRYDWRAGFETVEASPRS